MSPTAPRFHTQGLSPWRPSPEAPALPGRLGISEPFTSAVSLSLLLTLLQRVKYNLCRREGGRNRLSQGRRSGWRVTQRGKSDSPARRELPEAWLASDMVGQAAQSSLSSVSECLWSHEKDVCVLPSQSWQVPRGVLIRKQRIRLGDSRHLASDRCCSRRLSALFSFHNRPVRKMLLAHLTDVNIQAPRSHWLRLYRAGI